MLTYLGVRLVALATVAALFAIQGGEEHRFPNLQAPRYGFRVVHVFPHDPAAFTEGLLYWNGFLYESTGLGGKSRVRRVDFSSGKVIQEALLERRYFGEGITIFNNRIVQLTWRSGVGFVYDVNTLARVRTFAYTGEGWGLTSSGSEIFMSDGTPEIRCLDPNTFGETRRLHVHDGSHAIFNINELEYVRGEIFANVWLVRTKSSAFHQSTGILKVGSISKD